MIMTLAPFLFSVRRLSRRRSQSQCHRSENTDRETEIYSGNKRGNNSKYSVSSQSLKEKKNTGAHTAKDRGPAWAGLELDHESM